MSKTDKTNPYHVKWFYDPNYIEAVHRHEFHDCNLPPKPEPGIRDLHWESWHGPCFWYPSFQFYRSRWAKCGCPMCKRYAYTVSPAQRERRERKRYCRDGWRDEY